MVASVCLHTHTCRCCVGADCVRGRGGRARRLCGCAVGGKAGIGSAASAGPTACRPGSWRRIAAGTQPWGDGGRAPGVGRQRLRPWRVRGDRCRGGRGAGWLPVATTCCASCTGACGVCGRTSSAPRVGAAAHSLYVRAHGATACACGWWGKHHHARQPASQQYRNSQRGVDNTCTLSVFHVRAEITSLPFCAGAWWRSSRCWWISPWTAQG